MIHSRPVPLRTRSMCIHVRRVLPALLLVLLVHPARAQNQDVSDSLWSIVLPTVAVSDVDMGQALVGKVKDSVVTAYFRNMGSVPVRVDTLYFTGTDSALFSIVSGHPPFIVPVGTPRAIEFRFRAASVGVKRATIVIHAQVDTIIASIQGEGVEPRIDANTTLVDFGALTVNEHRDSTITAVIRNIGTAPLTVSQTRHHGPDSTQFIIVSGGGGFTLDPGQSRSMTLRFAPTRVGRTSGRIGFDHDAAGSPTLVDLYGEGLHILGSATIWIDSLRARIGDTVDVAIRMRDTVRVGEAGATRISTELRFNTSLLAPLDATPRGTQANRFRTILLDSLPIITDADGSLRHLRFIATLGDAEETALELVNTAAVDGMVTLTVQPGHFALDGICREGGARLVDASGRIDLFQNRPNPFNAATVIDFELIESGPAQLVVSDMLGRRVAVLIDATMERGRHTVRFDAAELPTGIYVITLQTATTARCRVMEVVK